MEKYTISEYQQAEKVYDNNKDRLLNDIINYADEFLKETYNIDLTVPIKINGRLSRSYGRFISTHFKEPLRVELSKRLIIHCILLNDYTALTDTVEHELIHYALCKLDLPYHDKDNYFQRELQKHNVPATMKKSILSIKHEYECGCKVFIEKKQFKNGAYICNSCKYPLIYKRKVIA